MTDGRSFIDHVTSYRHVLLPIVTKDEAEDIAGAAPRGHDLVLVKRYSDHPDDSHLFVGLYKRDDGTWTVWSISAGYFGKPACGGGSYDHETEAEAMVEYDRRQRIVVRRRGAVRA